MFKRKKRLYFLLNFTFVLRKLETKIFEILNFIYFRKKFLKYIDFFAKNNILLRV